MLSLLLAAPHTLLANLGFEPQPGAKEYETNYGVCAIVVEVVNKEDDYL